MKHYSLRKNLIGLAILALVSAFNLVNAQVADAAQEDALDRRLIEQDRQKKMLNKCAIFSADQIALMKNLIGPKKAEEVSFVRLSKLQLPMPLKDFVDRYGFPDVTSIVQNSPALSKPTVIWEYGDIYVFLGFGEQDKIEIVRIIEKPDLKLEKLKKRLSEHQNHGD